LKELKDSAQKVQGELNKLGYENRVMELPDSTRTAKEAADALGCSVGQIAKSILFCLKNANEPVLVVASGSNRINEQEVEKNLNDKLGKADADFVREQTGFVIGGVPPLAHQEPIMTFIDQDLFDYDEIWAAAGHPKAVFKLTPVELEKMTGGKVIAVK
jgi:prolyl-tRNA editing enzyme YbaK/EbsC (Cys-tRNA(Pro) deacylase)